MMRNVFNKNGLPEQLAGLSGRWVAIREDHVVADAETLRDLVRDERVKDTDTRYAVPTRRDVPSRRR
jgi:hypothetical protein